MIRIAERYRPFSHKPGASCVVPGTDYVVHAYPGLIRVSKDNETIAELPITLKKSFLLTQDLEQGFVSISGEFFVDETGNITLKKPVPRPTHERLSLGSSKAQNWDYIRERKDLREILPLWHKLASYYPYQHTIPNHYLNLYLSYFNPYFVPREKDEEHHGIYKDPLEKPYTLFSQKGVRSFLIEEKKDEIIIKRTPFTSGRIINAQTSVGTIHYEWTKNFPRQFIFEGDISRLQVTFPPEVSQYRVTNTEKGLLFDKFE